MEVVFEIIFAILEVLLQIGLEIGAEKAGHSYNKRRKKEPMHPFWAALGYACLGGIAGVISLMILPHTFYEGEVLRILNLIFTPILAGLVMAMIGRWRENHDQDTIRLDRFSYGYLFALCLGLVRYFGAA